MLATPLMFSCGGCASATIEQKGLTPGPLFHLLLFRDPNLAETLDVYDGSADYLRNLHLDEDELTKVKGEGGGRRGSGTGRR